MLILSFVQIPVIEKDPYIVLPKLIEIIQHKITNHREITINLSLLASSNPGTVLLLAKTLPENAKGFSYGRCTKKIDAKEFLSVMSASSKKIMVQYSGDLTDYLDYDASMKFIKKLLKLTPSAIKSTSFLVNISNIQWLEGVKDSSGTLQLFDAKAFARKKRFTLAASMSLPAENRRCPAVKKYFKQVYEKTGLNFAKGKISELPDPREQEQVTDEERLAWNVCFKEALVQSKIEIEKNEIRYAQCAGLSSMRGALNNRIANIMSGKSEKVNWPAIVKRFIKNELPEYSFSEKDGAWLIFSKRVNDFAELELIFEKQAFSGMGKAFTLLCNIRSLDKLKVAEFIGENIFSLFGECRNIPPYWSYTSKDELTEVMEDLIALLKQILPILEGKITDYFFKEPLNIGKTIRHRDAITAEKGFKEALQYSQAWDYDAFLVRVASHTKYIVREKMGPGIDISGKLKSHGTWIYSFHSAAKSEEMVVEIPAIGSSMVSFSKLNSDLYSANNPFLPINSGWVDSDEVMEKIKKKLGGGKLFDSDKIFEILLELKGKIWKVSILKTDRDGNRNDFLVDIDAE